MGVNIESGEYRISADEMNWVLSHKGGKEWRAIAWYGSLAGVLGGLMERKIKTLPAKTWEELSQGLREIKQELKAIEKQLSFQT